MSADLVAHIADGIRSYAIGEANEYDYRGDGSAVKAIRKLTEAADGIASYIVEEWERKGTSV